MRKNMMKIMVVILLFFVTASVPCNSIQANAKQTAKTTAKKAKKKVKKPGQVKGLKKTKDTCKWDGYRNVNTVKIKFNKVKGATGYQVLVYSTNKSSCQLTPLVYAYNTKKTAYTVKNLVPACGYNIKVRAYTKGKDGKVVYGKATNVKFRTIGEKKGCYHVCNSCGSPTPGNMNPMAEHVDAVYKLLKEYHAGGTYNWFY